jgi:ATP-dependent exoDNAse (exonuclease V) alpha subunit
MPERKEMNAPLTAIERAKLRLIEIKQQAAARKHTEESRILAATSFDVPSLSSKGWSIDNSVPWNEEQLRAINMGLSRKTFCLIGAAGTGKTTTLKGVVYSLLRNNLIPPIHADRSTKRLAPGTPGIVLVSFTNMAVRQVAKHFSGDITCVTIHKLLEYVPVRYEAVNEQGEQITKMEFQPSRNKGNPLPPELTTIVVDESSMVDCDLFQKLLDALPNPQAVQFIFLGDLNQLPPVYGGPILGKKLLELPIVELTRVYRQALESPIIRYAIKMKDGELIPVSQRVVEDNKEHGKVTIHPWAKSLSWEDALVKATGFCKAAIRDGALDPMQDIILCPFNVKFGVIDLNLAIADYLGRERGAQVHEVVAGFNTHYFAVGDKVLVQKREALITEIRRSGKYAGKRPADVNKFSIDRYGGLTKRKDASEVPDFVDVEFDVDAFMDSMQVTIVKDRVTTASHEIKVEFIGSEDEDGVCEYAELKTASEVNDMLFAYAITVHKSQGSEWRKVFFILHSSHAQMCSRELMYTGMTRAKQELYLIVEPDKTMKSGTLSNAAKKPRLKGNTLAEKLISLKERFAKEAAESQGKQKSINYEDGETE